MRAPLFITWPGRMADAANDWWRNMAAEAEARRHIAAQQRERAREEEQADWMAEGLPLRYYPTREAEEIGRLLEPPPLPLVSPTPRSVRDELRADRSVAFRVFRRDGYRCVCCGSDGTEPHNDLTVDHIIPVIRGGTNDPENLQTLCRSCNARKGYG